MRHLTFLIFFVLTNYIYTANASETYTFDKAHTQILFFVDHLGFSKSQGEFHDYNGKFVLDRDNRENSSVEITIQTASVDMDDEKWNEHMRNADFFNVEKFPTMTFESKDIEIIDTNKAKVKGNLTMLGITKPVTLNVKHNKSGEHPMSGKFIAGFSGNAVVKRSDFGMAYGLPMIGDDIEIRLEIEGIRENDLTNK